jgi:hypothetical protein
VFSFSSGIIHTYYTVALAPAIGALVAIGAATAWGHRASPFARGLFAVGVAISAWWAVTLLDRTPHWEPWLRPLIVGAAVVAMAGVLFIQVRRLLPVALAAAAIACLAGPLAYAAQTVTTAHTGSIPSAGPSSSAAAQGGGFGARAGGPGSGAGAPPSGAAGGFGGPPGAGTSARGSRPSGRGFTGRSFSGGGGAAGGATTVNSALAKALETDASAYRWVAATDGSQSAASIELATGDPVMAIGGFNGQDQTFTLAEFEQYVAKGEIHYYIAGGGMGGGPGGGSSGESAITSWVESHYTAQTIGGETVYSLSSSRS